MIPSVAVPLSLVGTFGVMYLLGYSLNNLTLMALTISTGFVVDDAIVMIENIMRYIEEGMPPLEAALKGLRADRLHDRLADRLADRRADSAAVHGRHRRPAVPRIRGDAERHDSGLGGGVADADADDVREAAAPSARSRSRAGSTGPPSAAFQAVIAFYGRTLRWVLRHQTATLLVAVATLVLTIVLYMIVPKGFFPVQDTGVILGVSEAPQTISFAAMAERQQALADVILKDPAVESLSSFIGVDGTNTTLNSGRIQINLKPLEQRTISASDVIRRLQPELVACRGHHAVHAAGAGPDGRGPRQPHAVSVQPRRSDAEELATWVPRFVARLQALPELRDVASDQQNLGLQTRLVIDRNTRSRLGITPQMIDDTLYDAFGQRQISTMFTQLNQYRVVLEVQPGVPAQPGRICSTSMCDRPGGGTVPLSAFTRIETSAAPLSVNHQGQFPVVTVSFNLAPGASLGEAVEAIEAAKTEIGLPAEHSDRAFRARRRRSRRRWPTSRC